MLKLDEKKKRRLLSILQVAIAPPETCGEKMKLYLEYLFKDICDSQSICWLL